ncbi:MAG: glycerate kinase [Gaiellaceae bacterium]
MRALASPASLKGVLRAGEAAAALAEGFRAAGVEVEEQPVADGGEGTARVLGATLREVVEVPDAFGRPHEAAIWRLPDGTAAVESAGAVPLDPRRLEPLEASSRGLGELIAHVEASELLVCLGGTANVDGGAGMRAVLGELPAPTTVLCDAQVPLLDAARLFGPQKGASPEQIQLLEQRLAAMEELAPYADLPGAGAAGGLGAALAFLGAQLVPGAEYVLERLRLRERAREVDLVVTGEGTVDRTTTEGKAPGEVARICREEGVRCVVFGGRVVEPVPDAEVRELSGDPARAREDLVLLARELAS